MFSPMHEMIQAEAYRSHRMRQAEQQRTAQAQVDVRYDRSRWMRDTGRPVLIPGERIEVRVPFEGEAELFYMRSNSCTSNPPRGEIQRNELVLRHDSPSDAARDVRPLVDQVNPAGDRRVAASPCYVLSSPPGRRSLLTAGDR